MINILLEQYLGQSSSWLFEELSSYIKPYHKVAVVAFSFRENRVHSLSDWNLLYGKSQGKFYKDIIESFGLYGICEDQITFINYFSDSRKTARHKIESSDILYFLGGLPDRMYDRLKEFDLIETVSEHRGIAIGYSAGALIQLAEYHLSPDDDYAEFGYYKGLPFIDDFYMEVHYENTDIQNACIERVLSEKKKMVYATYRTGAIIVDNGTIKLFGDVKVCQPSKLSYQSS